MQIGGGGGVKSDINVTPLVDVMLVLLIIMMIVAPLLQQGVSLTLPTAQYGIDKPETEDQTVVAIDPRGQFWVGAVEVSDADLGRRVREVLETKSERVVLIKADRAVEYSRVMAAMDALSEEGVEDIALITGQPADRTGEGE
jgi:biopolymer transport protein ExbD